MEKLTTKVVLLIPSETSITRHIRPHSPGEIFRLRLDFFNWRSNFFRYFSSRLGQNVLSQARRK